jgi:hypothetical protein
MFSNTLGLCTSLEFLFCIYRLRTGNPTYTWCLVWRRLIIWDSAVKELKVNHEMKPSEKEAPGCSIICLFDAAACVFRLFFKISRFSNRISFQHISCKKGAFELKPVASII